MAKPRSEDMADLTEAHVRRILEPRIHGRGRLTIERPDPASITIFHCYTSEWNGRHVALPIAQLRLRGARVHLYWRRINGRWVPYANGKDAPFAGSLVDCLQEIDADPWGCFWG